MKAVVVGVRRITKDVDDARSTRGRRRAGPRAAGASLQQRSRRPPTTSSRRPENSAAAAGLSPVSLLDAAASHLVAAVVEALRAVKIRPTPDSELDDDEDDGGVGDGTVTPVDSAGSPCRAPPPTATTLRRRPSPRPQSP